MGRIHVFLALLVVLAAGCASNPQPYRDKLRSETASVRSCAIWLRAVDDETDRTGVRDAGGYRIPGFPYLRIDRFLASFRGDIGADDEKFGTWWAQLRSLDAAARAFEARNLPERFRHGLAQPVAAPDPSEEWAFIPAELPLMSPGQRVLLRIAGSTHYVTDIRPDKGGGGPVSYAVADDDSLRSLPAGNGSRRSVYGPDGLVAGSERAERFLFWPMGIASAGAMRQWGRHATAFVGRRHFDDADLIERRFAIQLQ